MDYPIISYIKYGSRQLFGHRLWCTLFATTLLAFHVAAQVNINKAEYFFDADPGVGMASNITVATAGDSIDISQSISTSGLQPGSHNLFVRTRSNTGLWSLYGQQGFLIKPGITGAEYFFDTDPGAGNGIALAVAASQDSISFSGTIATTGLTAGNHLLFIRTKDNTGRWSLYEARAFFIKSNIVAAEYYIDTDPGVGNGTAIGITASEDSINKTTSIVTPLLQRGWHKLYVRTRSGNGIWSVYEGRDFFVKSGIISAEYYIDNDPGPGNGTAISITASEDSVTKSASINTGVLSSGYHNLYVRAKDNAGAWSLYEGRSFFVKPSIIAAEYFVDKDPGPGNGTAISITAGEDSIVKAASLTISCIDSGMHLLYVRTKNSNQVWSLYESDTFYISNPAPVISAAGSNTICTGDSVVLSVNTAAACSYQWYRNAAPVSGAVSRSYTAHIGGAYQLYMYANLDTFASNSINITVGGTGTPPAITFSPDTVICAGSSVLLTATPDTSLSFAWSTGAGTQSITAAATGFYYVTVTDSTGCEAEANIHITVKPNPTANAYVSGLTCENGNIQLNSTGGSTYTWSGPLSYTSTTANPVITTAALTASGIYTVTVTAANGCTATDTAQLAVLAQPAATAANTGPYCAGDSIKLSSGTGVSYAWNGPASFSSAVQNPVRTGSTPGMAGSYTVTVTNANGCTNTASTSVTINSTTAAINTSGPATFCSGGSVVLIALGGNSYAWSTGGVWDTITATATGTYTVTVTSALGCSATASKSVTVNSLPTATAAVSSPACAGGSVTLSATGGGTYAWSGPNAFTSAQQTPLLSSNAATALNGTYTVTVTASGCSATATTAVSVNAVPTAAASNSGPYCVNQHIKLTGGGGVSYTWSGPAAYSSTTQSPAIASATLAKAGTYILTATNAAGCTDTAQTQVVVSSCVEICNNGLDDDFDGLTDCADPDCGLSASITTSGSASLCPSQNVILTANPASQTYAWSNTASTRAVTVSTAATYIVTVTGGNGCTDTAQVAVTTNPSPSAAPTNTGPYCTGTGIELAANASGAATYAWSGPSSFTSTAANALPGSASAAKAGIYNLTVTSSAGCTAIAATTVAVNRISPTLAFSGSSGFTSHVVSPLSASPYNTFVFEVKYTDADNNKPGLSYPRILVDYDNDGGYGGINDRSFAMQQTTPNDTVYSNGKLYFYNATGLIAGQSYRVKIVAEDSTGCSASFGPFDEPDVLDDADLGIFANDISFSDAAPDTAAPLTVYAVVHNNSDYPASNFVVRLLNQYDTTVNYDLQTVPYLAAHQSTTVSWNITTPHVASWNPMQVFIDYSNIINEPNELDNQAIRPFVCGNFNLPGDIKITAAVNPAVSYATPNNMLSVSGRATYRNTAVVLQDPSCAGATVTVYVPSTGATYSGNTNSNGDYAIGFQAPVTPGSYSVNVSITDFTLDGDTTAAFGLNNPPCLPDLYPVINLSSYNIMVGQSISGTITVTNQGCDTPAVQTRLSYSMLGTNTDTAVALLPPGASQLKHIPATVFNTPGTYQVCATADASVQVAESNENNTSCRSITVNAIGVDISPAGYIAGSVQYCSPTASYSFDIRNLGASALSTPFKVRYTIRRGATNIAVYSSTISNIAGNNRVTDGFTHTYADTGHYTVLVACDTTLAVTELDEANNTMSGNVYVYECPAPVADLSVGGCGYFDVTPVQPHIADSITVYGTVFNNGNLNVSAPFVVRINANGETYNHTVASLAANSSIAIQKKIKRPVAQTGMLSMTADYTAAVAESDESNNTSADNLCYDMRLGVRCYYTVGDEFWERTYTVNQPVSMLIWLYNDGHYQAQNVRTKFEVSGPGLPAGYNNAGSVVNTNVDRTCSCPYAVSLATPFSFPQTGTYSVRMTTDADGLYTECEESDNVMTVNVVVTNLPDYRILSQYIAPSLLNPDVNQPITIDVSYENLGANNIGDSLNIGLEADNSFIGKVRAMGLAPNDYFTVSIPQQWSSSVPGVHVLRARADYDGEVTEYTELNNTATRSIVVGQSANLYFAQFTISDTIPVPGDTITISTVIGNNGDEDATAKVTLYYVNDMADTIEIANQTATFLNNANKPLGFLWKVTDASTTIVGRITNANPIEYTYDDNNINRRIGALQLAVSTASETCIGDSNGTARVSVSGGVAPFVYSWSNGRNDSLITVKAGTYRVTVYDAQGSSAIAAAIVPVIPDNQAPLIFNMPSDITYVASNGICPAAITWAAPGTSDNCAVDSFYSNKQPGALFNAGITVVTYTAKDKAGNTAQLSFNIEVIGAPSVFAGNDKSVCTADTLNALAPAFGTGTWSVASGSATFVNANNPTTGISNMIGSNRLVWTVINGSCPAVRDTVVISDTCGTPTWTGAYDDDFSNPLNWSPQITPSCARNLIVPASANPPVIQNGNASAGDIQLAPGATIEVINRTLTICGDIVGGISDTGEIITTGTGVVVLNAGFGIHHVTGKVQIGTLVLNDPAGAVIDSGAMLRIDSILELRAGNLNTASGTAVLGSGSPEQCGIINDFGPGYTGTITGNVVAQRYVPVPGINQHFISSPLQNRPFSDIGVQLKGTNNVSITPTANCSEDTLGTGSNYGNVFEYNENRVLPGECYLKVWTVRSSGTMQHGRGYSVYLNNGVFDLVGVPTTGDITLAGLTNSSWSSVSSKGNTTISGWQLVGNPYPSYLSLTADHVAQGFDAQVQVWETSGPYQGTYQPYIMGSGGNAGLAPFQAFMIHKTVAGGTSDFTMYQSERTTAPVAPFYKTQDNKLLLEVSGNGFRDKTNIEFNATASAAFDPAYDAYKFGSGKGQPTFYSYTSGERFGINTLPSVAAVPDVPVHLQAGSSGLFTIKASQLETFDPTVIITLEDKLTGSFQNLRVADNYTFAANKNDADSRFVVHFTTPVQTGTADAVCAQNGVVEMQPASVDWDYALVDANNTSIKSGVLSGGKVIISNLAPANYTLLLTYNGYTVTKQLSVGGNLAARAAVATAVNGNTVTFTNTSANATHTTMLTGDGTVITDEVSYEHTYSEPGIYVACIIATNAGGCADTSCTTISLRANGVEEAAGAYISAVPNPFSNQLSVNVAVPGSRRSSIRMIDQIGRTVWSSDYNHINGLLNATISTDKLAAGIYFLHVQSGDKKYVLKVMKD
jgi:hypothetical protein